MLTNKGKINRQPVHFVDIMATVREMTDASYPASLNGERITPLQGESLLPAFQGEVLPKRDKPIYFEYRSGGAVRDGKWKLVRGTNKKRNGKFNWELYDLIEDITETTDVASENPEVVQRLSSQWQDWYVESYGR